MCQKCDGHALFLVLEYVGPGDGVLVVISTHKQPPVFDGLVDNGELFRVDGNVPRQNSPNDTLGGTITIEVLGMILTVHTSCSVPVFVGLEIYGTDGQLLFIIRDGASMNGGFHECPEPGTKLFGFVSMLWFLIDWH